MRCLICNAPTTEPVICRTCDDTIALDVGEHYIKHREETDLRPSAIEAIHQTCVKEVLRVTD